MNAHRLQAWLLRLAGAIELLAFIAVVMPRSWMEIAHGSAGKKSREASHGSISSLPVRLNYEHGNFEKPSGLRVSMLNRIVARFRETLAARSAYSLIIQKFRPAV